MWAKYLLIVFIFYIFALLQNSFFVNFSLLGINPNLVFILFILLIFFEKKPTNFSNIYFAIIAGFFLDIFSSIPLGWSILILIVIGYLIKKIKEILSEKNDSYPYAYFAIIFTVTFFTYSFLLNLVVYFILKSDVFFNINLVFVFKIIYNLILASGLFFVYKKFMVENNSRQQRLF
jgi:rod shape-determining protein MreD